MMTALKIEWKDKNIVIKLLDELIELKDVRAKNKELEKIIELMNEYIVNECISPKICSKHTAEDCYADIYDDNACRECVLEYFKKKAKGE